MGPEAIYFSFVCLRAVPNVRACVRACSALAEAFANWLASGL